MPDKNKTGAPRPESDEIVAKQKPTVLKVSVPRYDANGGRVYPDHHRRADSAELLD
jgi:hypothetical protein